MNYTKISEKEILNWLKNNLTPERYEHSLGTADCAKALAIKYGADEQKAYLAGLLHDCAKCLPIEKLKEITSKMHIDPQEVMSPKTLHSPASAYVANTEFGVTDNEILSAIHWHTLGKKNMTLFEKIIYLADKIEYRTRKEEYAEPIRKILDKTDNLDMAILESYRLTIESLKVRKLEISPLTIEIYNHLQKSLKV